ncbi:MAG: dihydrolipoyl dehydrogenase [Bacteroidetes bacterium]|nr:dihydrolipoyl dehydrogenase [Bacteroidota bacterium]
MNFDILVIGSGPGGYVAAIRASQLGKKVAIIERSEVGGICLNWGCIPTKALLKSAHVFAEIKRASEFGIEVEGEVKPSFDKIISRSRGVASTMSKGVQFLLKKANVEIIAGFGKLLKQGEVEVTKEDGSKEIVTAENIILATGARARALPNIIPDDKQIITYRKAMSLEKQPKSMVVIGSGAIGMELASFYHELGTKVTVVEFLPNLVPNEDVEISKYLERSCRKNRLAFMTKSAVETVEKRENDCLVTIKNAKGITTVEAEIVLMAAGVQSNIENIGLEELNITTERGKVIVDDNYMTNVKNVYAIGDIIPTPALAHVASAEALYCVEHICGLTPRKIDYQNIPACIYTQPEIASVGLNEAKAIAEGYEVRVGKFPYTASGKATATGDKDGFIKLVFDKKTDKVLGGSFIGTNVTEMLMEVGMAKTLGGTAMDMIKTIHPHPTLSEALMEAAATAHNECVHV